MTGCELTEQWHSLSSVLWQCRRKNCRQLLESVFQCNFAVFLTLTLNRLVKCHLNSNCFPKNEPLHVITIYQTICDFSWAPVFLIPAQLGVSYLMLQDGVCALVLLAEAVSQLLNHRRCTEGFTLKWNQHWRERFKEDLHCSLSARLKFREGQCQCDDIPAMIQLTMLLSGWLCKCHYMEGVMPQVIYWGFFFSLGWLFNLNMFPEVWRNANM